MFIVEQLNLPLFISIYLFVSLFYVILIAFAGNYEVSQRLSLLTSIRAIYGKNVAS